MRRSDRSVLKQQNADIRLSSKQRTKREQSLRNKENTGLSNYRFIQFIGKGTFGKVYSAIDIKTERKVAIKVVELYTNYQNRELDIIKRIQHPNCIELQKHFVGYDHEAKVNKNYELTLYLVMQELDFSLAKYIQIRRKRSLHIFNMAELKIISFQLFKALDYLNGKQICHRDLKPQNVLINGDTLDIKICDYGSAKIIEEGQRAPELLFGHTRYTTAIDTWSIGCILMELLTGQPIFPGQSTLDQIIEIIKILGSPSKEFFEQAVKIDTQGFNFPKIQPLKLERLFARYKVEQSFIDLISKCLEYNWHKRLSPSAALLQPFFDNIQSSQYDKYTQQLPSLFDFSKNLLYCSPKNQQKILKKFKTLRRTGSKKFIIEETNQNISTQVQSNL